MPKVSQKGANGGQKGATWRPKGAKSEARGDQSASKSRPSAKIAKREPKVMIPGMFFDSILSYFPSKIDGKIDAEIDAEKVRKIKENTRRKWTCILMIFGFASHEKLSFSKKVHVREP